MIDPQTLPSVLDALPMAVGIVDADGRLVHANAGWRVGAGVHPWVGLAQGDYEAALRADESRVHDEARAVADAIARARADAGIATWRIEYAFGEARSLRHWTTTVRRVEHGCVLVTHEDVTHPRSTEAAFKRSQARLRTILTGAPLVLFSLDARGVFTLVEGMGAGGGGFAGPEQVGSSIFTSYAHMPALLEIVDAALRGDIGVTTVQIGRLAFEVRCSPLLGSSDEIDGVVGVATDVSERVRVQRMKDEFLSIVSHELRTPLTSIRGSLGLLEGGVVGALPERAHELVQIARINTDRLVRLISDMLDLDKMEEGLLELQRQSLALREVIEASMHEMAGLAAHIGVTLDHGSADGIELQLIADRDRLVQVLVNLLSNAIKFSPTRGTVKIAMMQRSAFARVEVTDQGPGIAAEDQPRLFQKFSQLDASDSRARGGSGLGLVICKRIIEASGGRIGVISTPGRGSRFWFELPLPVAVAVAPSSMVHATYGETEAIAPVGVAASHGGDRIAELLRCLAEAAADGRRDPLSDAHAAATIAAATLAEGPLRTALMGCVQAIDGVLSGTAEQRAERAAQLRATILAAVAETAPPASGGTR
ncbi:MAG: PAS domain-containing sensor histidine kinase [Deltaproteobacteria bacterium]|nr:PAS domain-containing sensor histidine kinase [Deltaproteobacteria bacterium]MBK8234361.1 PAS domain-containing sensor histidine kinase [Deltaproteobacteria bacterium]MBK8715087.1 PAS domain-containing sensor histidine kinase [Deltaproteobacteria bacterium]MBP7287103.1 PAS domain-containing sensor histidine kinase [Nannocystaceae bacterium]